MAKTGLKKVLFSESDFPDVKIGLVFTEWNNLIIEALRTACIDNLVSNGIKPENIISLEVPGSFELPLGAKILMEQNKIQAVICLGCVIKGETSHDEHINRAVSSGIMQLSIFSNLPVIFGVLTTNNEAQAKERACGKKGNKGEEAAIAALKMIRIKQSITQAKKKIGY
ncbi:MAG TPA: 6,7-dimethyl-8-ribityllumazine synthase [Saprospiraceae bacterium]|nr:6,7-dimethyl-8-ribityllumazine synthase [Saprospiraceae bacterium]